jgi:undecaprenyl pyrophosphate synthase
MTSFTSSTLEIPRARRIPRHVAVIMDGNGRWAKQRHLPRVAGHRRGVKSVRDLVRACAERGVEYLTLFAFSSENWRRPAEEVTFLMQLFVMALEQEIGKLHDNGIRFKLIGDLSRFETRLVGLAREAEALTAANQRLTLTIAANYGGRWDVLQAANRMLREHPRLAAGFSEGDLTPYLISSSGRGASNASAISCCGSWHTPSSISPTRCGRTSMPRGSIAPSFSTSSANAASDAPASSCPPAPGWLTTASSLPAQLSDGA